MHYWRTFSKYMFCVPLHSRVQYLIPGGWHASTENTDKVERYDARKNKWTSVCPMQERRYRPGVSVLNNRIYVMGGEEGWDR